MSTVDTLPKSYRGVYDPHNRDAFKISRSKIELYKDCERCFYLDRRLGIERPPGFPFNLNKAVDELLKKEFDVHRAKATAHPLMKSYGLDAVPYEHKDIDTWRENFVGLQAYYQPANFLVFGAVDDIWQLPNGELVVVDYKATSKKSEITIDAPWQISYKRQLEVYQWLLRQKGFKVSSTGYFVYANGDSDAKAFDARLEFNIKLIPYSGSDEWVEPTLDEILKCLRSDSLPLPPATCDYCKYFKSRVEKRA